MSLQGVAAIHAISGVDPYLLTNQLNAWHALFESPFTFAPILRAIWVSLVFALPPLIAALVIFNRRDVADCSGPVASLIGASSAALTVVSDVASQWNPSENQRS
jgi:hypothetical protein